MKLKCYIDCTNKDERTGLCQIHCPYYRNYYQNKIERVYLFRIIRKIRRKIRRRTRKTLRMILPRVTYDLQIYVNTFVSIVMFNKKIKSRKYEDGLKEWFTCDLCRKAKASYCRGLIFIFPEENVFLCLWHEFVHHTSHKFRELIFSKVNNKFLFDDERIKIIDRLIDWVNFKTLKLFKLLE